MNTTATALAMAACTALIAACSHSPAAPEVPDNLKAPAAETLALEVQATGVQIYQCKVTQDDSKRVEWTFKAPEAELYDRGGKHVGKHYAGPTWEAEDGSKIVGDVKAKSDSPDAHAIAWLLLSVKSNWGAGVFSGIKSVQRLQTVGGKAPTEGCDREHVGTEQRVPYQAAYYFYRAAS